MHGQLNTTLIGADPLKDAKKHVKNAQNALNAMMSGNQPGNMNQVTGNLTLAANAMNKMKPCVFLFFFLLSPFVNLNSRA